MNKKNTVPVTFTVTVEMSEEMTTQEIREIGQSIAHAISKQAQEYGLTVKSEAITQEVTVRTIGGSIAGYEQVV
jgi:divalent metal cation (Fe/Co/Zn/Cd) transporter